MSLSVIRQLRKRKTMDKEQLINNLSQPIVYPDGIIYDNCCGENIPRITPENFGVLHTEMCDLKAVVLAMLEEQ